MAQRVRTSNQIIVPVFVDCFFILFGRGSRILLFLSISLHSGCCDVHMSRKEIVARGKGWVARAFRAHSGNVTVAQERRGRSMARSDPAKLLLII